MNSLIKLYTSREVNQATAFAGLAEELDETTLAGAYLELVETAPRRHQRDKTYLSGRDGIPGGGGRSNRREEHLAAALRNASLAGKPFVLPDGRRLAFLDYQTPLKARRGDVGIGKVDLFGCLDEARACVIELKVARSRDALADTPLRALLEALAYCAIIEANATEIAEEALALHARRLDVGRPALLVMAPSDYWLAYLSTPACGDWLSSVGGLVSRLQATLNMDIAFTALVDARLEMGLDGEPPRLTGDCRLQGLHQLPASEVGGCAPTAASKHA